MNMPIYQFSMPLDAADLDVEVVNYDSGSVTSVSDDPTDGPDGNLLWRVELDEGDYFMRAKDAPGESVFTANGTLDVVASIANTPGASETAYLVATGVVGATDQGSVHIPLELDDTHGTAPDWLVINGSGDVELGLDAGGIFLTGYDIASIDFSGTTPADGELGLGITAKVNGQQVTTGNAQATGDGQDVQELQALAVDQTGYGTLAFYAEVSATDSEAAPITDGVVSHDVYVVLKKGIDVSGPA